MSSEANLNLLQELPMPHQDKKGRPAYNFDSMTLSYLQTKARQQDKRLQAIEEMVAAIYLAVDDIRSSLARGASHAEVGDEQQEAGSTTARTTRPLSKNEKRISKAPETSTPSLWSRLFNPRCLRRHPPF